MSKFEIGDRVRVTHYGKNETGSIYAGLEGRISSLPLPKWDYYRIKLDNEPPSGIDWYSDLPVSEAEIEPVDG